MNRCLENYLVFSECVSLCLPAEHFMWKCDYHLKVWLQDSQTDAGQSDHYVPLIYASQATQKVSPVWLVSTVMNVSGQEHRVNIPSLASWKTHPEYQQDAFVKQGCPPAATKSKYGKYPYPIFWSMSKSTVHNGDIVYSMTIIKHRFNADSPMPIFTEDLLDWVHIHFSLLCTNDFTAVNRQPSRLHPSRIWQWMQQSLIFYLLPLPIECTQMLLINTAYENVLKNFLPCWWSQFTISTART